jgi:hypothetical protein
MVFFGDKTISLFDVWSLEHFICGVGIGSFCLYLSKFTLPNNTSNGSASVALPIRYYLPMLFAISYFWEAIEFYAEAGYTNIDAVTYWFQGVEYWANRIITDPLMMIAGGILGIKKGYLAIWARVFSVIWLYFHIMVFPHSMYLQNMFDEYIR